jgi:hypothetical protein
MDRLTGKDLAMPKPTLHFLKHVRRSRRGMFIVAVCGYPHVPGSAAVTRFRCGPIGRRPALGRPVLLRYRGLGQVCVKRPWDGRLRGRERSPRAVLGVLATDD